VTGFLAVGNDLAISSDGAQLCGWGWDTTGHRYWPQEAGPPAIPAVCVDGTDITQIVGGYADYCILHKEGGVSCWGNAYGMAHPPGVNASLDPGSQLAAGGQHFCAVQKDGRLFCWGDNVVGQLGIGQVGGDRSQNQAPHEVKALGSNVVAIGSGHNAAHTCAILRDGSLVCWGKNSEAQLGNGQAGDPVPTPVAVKW
jgi:hypothetical protein